MEKQKSILCDALTRLGVNLIGEMTDKKVALTDEMTPVDDIAKEIVQYTDISDCKVNIWGSLEGKSPQGFSNAQNSRLI